MIRRMIIIIGAAAALVLLVARRARRLDPTADVQALLTGRRRDHHAIVGWHTGYVGPLLAQPHTEGRTLVRCVPQTGGSSSTTMALLTARQWLEDAGYKVIGTRSLAPLSEDVLIVEDERRPKAGHLMTRVLRWLHITPIGHIVSRVLRLPFVEAPAEPTPVAVSGQAVAHRHVADGGPSHVPQIMAMWQEPDRRSLTLQQAAESEYVRRDSMRERPR